MKKLNFYQIMKNRYSDNQTEKEDLSLLHPEEFAFKLVPKWKRYAHQKLFGDIVANAVIQAEKDPLNIVHPIITAPPQIGKSFFFGTPLPAWYLNLFPTRSVIYASHTYSLAERSTWKTREFVINNQDRLSFKLDPSQKQKGMWYTNQGGFMLAAGKGSAIPGYPADLIIVDDLYSSEEEAYSPRQLEKIEDWWDTSLYSRMQSHTLIIIMMTRWNKHDIVGTLLKRSTEDERAEKFRHWNFPALIETEAQSEADPLHRKVGEAVCPDRFNADFYRKKKASVNLFHWSALWQGEPTSEQGQMFQDCWFQYFSEDAGWLVFHPPNKPEKRFNKYACLYFQVTDTNMKDASKNDYHVTMTLGLTPENDLFVYDVYRDHIEGADTLRTIKQQRLKHLHGGNSYILKNFVEDTQAGTIAIQQARKLEDGFLLTPVKAEKSKRVRAIPLQELYMNFKVYHPSGVSFLKVLEDEILSFTGEEGGVDDQLDCLAYGAIILLNRGVYGLTRAGSLEKMNAGEVPKKNPLLQAPPTSEARKFLKLS